MVVMSTRDPQIVTGVSPRDHEPSAYLSLIGSTRYIPDSDKSLGHPIYFLSGLPFLSVPDPDHIVNVEEPGEGICGSDVSFGPLRLLQGVSTRTLDAFHFRALILIIYR